MIDNPILRPGETWYKQGSNIGFQLVRINAIHLPATVDLQINGYDVTGISLNETLNGNDYGGPGSTIQVTSISTASMSVGFYVNYQTGGSSRPYSHEVRIKFIPLGWGTQAEQASAISTAVNATNIIVEPLGYDYVGTSTDWDNNVVHIYYAERGTPAIPAATIIGAVVSILIASGLFLIAVSVYTYSGVLQTEAKNQSDATELINEKYRNGEITYDQYVKALDTIKKATNPGLFSGLDQIMQTAIYLALIVAVVYLALTFMERK